MNLDVLRRGFPNANSVWLGGSRPILVDAGAPGGEAGLLAWLGTRHPALLVNTHWHSDHTGGNHALAAAGVPIAAERSEAAMVNAGHPDACRSAWLDQPVAQYQVERCLEPGEILDTGLARWEVVALPGHTTGQIGLFDPLDGILVAGDALHANDVGWLDLDADPAALEQAEATIEFISRLAPHLVLSGHGPGVTQVEQALAGARRRIASWRAAPERIAWHACKRIFGHLLYTENGLARDQVAPKLLAAPWLRDHARRAFGMTAESFLPLLVTEMTRSGAATWCGDRLLPGA